MKIDVLQVICLVFLLGLIAFCLQNSFLLLFSLIFLRWISFKQAFLCFLLALSLASILFQFAEAKQSRIIEPREVTLQGYVRVQEIRPNGQQRLRVHIEDTKEEQLPGEQILISTSRYPEAKKGSRIEVNCLLESPEPFDGFAYDRYLATQGVYYLCNRAKVSIINTTVEFQQKPFEYLRIKIANKIESLWPRPQSSLVLGLLLGTRESFPQSTLIDFQRAGVTHIIALSGFNITILIVFLESIAIQCLLPKRIRLPIIVGGILLFTLFVGAGASITRAAIMGSLVLIANYTARVASPLRLMILTAACMSAFNPFILLYDLGFQLSFLSTFGLLYLTSFFQRCFFWVPNLFSLQESLATTMAATATTLPLILYQFEQLSTVSPMANMLILPIIPWLMALGALATTLAWVHPLLAFPFQWMVDLGCQYILSISKFMGAFSWAAIPIRLSFPSLVVSYIGLFILIYYEHKKASPHN